MIHFSKLVKKLLISTALLSLAIAAKAQIFETSLAPDDKFLPEAEAYVVVPNIEQEKISFRWIMAEGYYLYRHQLGLKLSGPDGLKDLAFSVPDGIIKFDEVFQKDFEVYYQTLTLSTDRIELPEGTELVLLSQGCADAGLCYPPRTQYFTLQNGVLIESATPTTGDANTAAISNSANANTAISSAQNAALPLSNTQEQGLLAILIGALIGGMILNLMPCVFPVLSLKALTLASGDQAEHRVHGWAYTAGVVLSFIGVAGILISAKSAGDSLGWGFQLQQPVFIAALIYLFFLLAMNLFGMFEVGTSWMGVGQNLTQGHGVAPSFFTGVLAAVVASPCTAPFMATAIGFTLTQGPIITLIVFTALGFGMALPYLILSHSRVLASRLPNPGPWMDVFKQFLAFPLLLTCVWLLVVLGNQTSAYAGALMVGGMITLGFALWLVKHQPLSPAKWLVRILALASVAVALNLAVTIENHTEDNKDTDWQPYSEQRLNELRQAGFAVFVDLTADWCITCKINERVALVDSVLDYAEEKDIILMRGDWTKSDPEITKLLHKFDRNGVPLYLMYPELSDDSPEVLPQILTPGVVLDAMKRAVDDVD